MMPLSMVALFFWGAAAVGTDDAFIAGYATAILEREFSRTLTL